MTLDEFSVEYENLSTSRQREVWDKVFNSFIKSPEAVDNNYGILQEILGVLVVAEAEDYFGTEGFEV